MREYIAFYDNGQRFCSFYFDSDHRVNSKANLEDARRKMILKYGKSARHYTITNVQLHRGKND